MNFNCCSSFLSIGAVVMAASSRLGVLMKLDKNQRKPRVFKASDLCPYYNRRVHSSDNAGSFHISFSFSAADKAPLCKGGWQKSLISDWGIGLCRYATIPPSRLAPCHLPLHKGGFVPTIILQITLLVSVNRRRLY